MSDLQSSSRRKIDTVRVLFVTILLLSGFLTAKSFIATANVEQWTGELRAWIRNDMPQPKDQRHPGTVYENRMDAVQKEWPVIRYVSLGVGVLAILGILASGRRMN